MRVLGWLMFVYLRLVWLTARVEVSGNTDLRARAIAGQARFVYGIWHGRLTGGTYDAVSGVTLTGIASRSGDGDFASHVLTPFGVRLIRGSSANPRKPEKNKGGAAALAAALRFLEDDPSGIVALTPDGPKGPRGVCHHGVAAISIRTGAPVVPIAWSAKYAIRVGSWDHALVPLPFTRVHLIWGEALIPPESGIGKEGTERFRKRVEAALFDLTVAADRRAGRRDVFTKGAR